jgi:ferrochelatase
VSDIDAVLLVAFGGPTAPEEIRPFLDNVVRDRRIPAERLAEVARHYEQMPGARSPLNELTERQAAGLRRELERRGRPAAPVFVGMRNWHPFLHETLATMAAAGLRRAVAVILSPFRCEASWDRYMDDVRAARARVPAAPSVTFAPSWPTHPGFVAAAAERVRAALATVPADERADTPVVFTAHSIPRAMADGAPYADDFAGAARAVGARVPIARWSLAYQSRSGSPREPWLEPDIGRVIQQLRDDGVRRVVAMPLGFVCDHVEVLYDLDVEARALAAQSGVAFHRAEAVNDHPDFVAMLADLVTAACA